MTIFSQLRPFTIGYDDVFRHFDHLLEHNSQVVNYPPYNIVRTGDYTYDVEVALAGYSKAEIEVKVEENTLTIKTANAVTKDKPVEKDTLHQGISRRAFTRTFTLAEDVEVKDAQLKDGLLKVSIERIVPDEKKPRSIKIN